jgi:hypothetical protein
MKSPTGVEAEDWLRCPLILKFPWGSPQLSHFHLIERGLLGMRTLAKKQKQEDFNPTDYDRFFYH